MTKSIISRTLLILGLLLFAKTLSAQLLSLSVNNGGDFCLGEVTELTINGGTSPYIIDFGDGSLFIQTAFTPLSYTYNDIGNFLIIVTDATGQNEFLSIEVFSCGNTFIVGNESPCVGDCEVYTIPGAGQFINWQIINTTTAVTLVDTSDPVLNFCWDTPGEYVIIALGPNVNENYFVTVSGSNVPIDIVPLTNTFCQGDSINPTSCEKICANSTAIYTVPNGQNVTWEVLGADSFEPDGNQVTVEWGAAGSGLVNASVAGTISNELEAICSHELEWIGNSYDFELSSAVSGGVAPYTYLWTASAGATWTTSVVNFPPAFAFGVGEYTLVVTDAVGNTSSCTVFSEEIVNPNGGGTCHVIYDYHITEPTDCNTCDGLIDIDISHVNPQSTAMNIDWATQGGITIGSSPNLVGLCEGTYTLTAIDWQTAQCTFEKDFTVDCGNVVTACPSESTICVDILEDPEANFSTIPDAVNGVVNICEGGTVVFNNESEGASLYEWSFGNGNVATSTNAEQTYLSAGTYECFLISRNDCYCSDTTFLTIEVEDAISPTLDCVGTICENTTVTYTTDASCGSYDWTITGDYNIIDGGGIGDKFITIEWLTGPQGIIQLGVSGCSGGNFCVKPTVEVVPIISDNAIIKGPEKVCRLDEATYFLNDYSATDFIWTVSNGGSILEGQNSSSIKVRWDGPLSVNADQWVSVVYDNCYLGCGGSDTKDIYILPEFYVEGDIEVCENETSFHQAKKDIIGSNAINCTWTVNAGDGTLLWTSPSASDQVLIDWNSIATGSGRYSVQATPSNSLEVCNNTFTNFMNVVQIPSAPTSISGATEICLGQYYTYEANSPHLDYIFKWEINDGGNITTHTGSTVNVSFGSTPPYILNVTQTSTDGLACESNPASLEVFPIGGFTTNGDTEVCIESQGVYTAQLFQGASYEWNIVPNGAGTITSGGNSNSIEVFWHQVGDATIEVTMCNSTETIPVAVIGKPQPNVTGDLFVCPGESTTVGVATSFASYLWKTESGSTITNTPTADLPIGAYELIVTNSSGCENNIAFRIEGYPSPEVSISVPGSRVKCYIAPNIDSLTIFQATEVPAGYTYQWYHNGTPILNTNNSEFVSQEFGVFQVGVLDEHGCETLSNMVTIHELCFGGGVSNDPNLPIGCDIGTDVQYIFSGGADCNTFDFQNTSPDYTASTILWDFDDPASGANNASTLENPTHEFSSAGNFIVTLISITSTGALCWDSKIVTVPISANFDFGIACPNEAIAFEDLTQFLPNEIVQSWSWDFGEPSSGANNTSTEQHPSHTYAAVGSYDVTLTSTHTSGCTSTITKTVTIEVPPTVTFDDPVENCEGSTLSFIAQPSADVLFYSWDFGDPSSGAANTSSIKDPFHNFENTGNYNVTCTVTDIWGCSSSSTNIIGVSPNSLGGTVSFSQPSPICDGDMITLTAPAGGVAWEWSDGSTTESITTGEAGAYMVTITDNIGCQYVAPSAVVDILGLPNATIQAVEYDEFGNPINIFYDTYTTCEGEDIFLQVTAKSDFTYTWSNGTLGSQLDFIHDHDTQLTAGIYTYTLDIIDNISGCTNTVGPFDITVYPTPTDIQISSNPNSPVCENTLTTLSVDNPSVDLTYVWNTGELGTTIQVSAGGEYFVKGITTFGCIGESNIIEILPGPDIKRIPNGCQTRCGPDTICLPTMNGISSYQWYLDGVAIPGPDGTVGDLIAQSSGDYHVVMIDDFGCSTTSDILSLDLFDGFGSLEGNVYMDVNGNGFIDAADTLVSGIDIILTNNGIAIDTTTSGTGGSYSFGNILSTDYNLQIDLSGLSSQIVAVYNNVNASLVGCDVEETVDWLLQINCAPNIQNFEDEICFGDAYIFDGVVVPSGVPTDFEYSDMLGCDSVVTVTITELPDNNFTTTLNACEGTDITYNGMTLMAGSITQIPLVSPQGCPYVETVEVASLTAQIDSLDLEVCFGEMGNYNGQQLATGSQTDFTFPNQFGCDSIVTVSVIELADNSFDTQLSACDGNDITYNGMTLAAGSTTQISLTSPQGCPYIETVEVASLPTSSEPLNLEVCFGEMGNYNGQQLAAGSQTDFTFSNQFGCDSFVTVTVTELPDNNFTTEINACNGNDVTYNGQTLAIGSITQFPLVSPQGCPYFETVEVVAFPVNSTQVNLEVCFGEIGNYNGQQLVAGTQTDFTFPNQFNCDSLVTVTVVELPDDNFTTQLSACEGNDITYNGLTLAAGSTMQIPLTSPQGCAYFETVEVASLPTSSESLNLEVCFGEMGNYNGQQLAAGSQTDFTFPNQYGCDSIVTVSVIELPDDNFTTQLSACDGNDIMYNGLTLAAGSTTQIPLTSPQGCAYFETVEVASLPTSSEPLNLEVCFGEMGNYNGQQLAAGSQTDFTFPNQYGCDSIVTVSVIELPDNNFDTQLSACDGGDIIYNGLTLVAGSTTQILLVSPQGCPYFETVEVIPLPTNSTIIDLEVCFGEVAEFEGQQLVPNSQTEFIYLNQLGCDSIVVVSVLEFPEIQFDMAANEPCWNSNDGTITILPISGTAPFEYSINGNNFQTDPLFENLFPTTYDVVMSDANGCQEEVSFALQTIPQLEMEIIAPQLPCDGSNIILQPQFLSANPFNIIYEWSDGSTDPTLSINEMGVYHLTVTNDCETIVEEVNVTFENDGRDEHLYIPNTFSPNGDGHNDIFKIYPSPDIEVLSFDFFIFDRWGNHLYDTHDVQEGWDGWMNGEEFNPGVYVYYVRANVVSCGRTFEIFRKGDVTITK